MLRKKKKNSFHGIKVIYSTEVLIIINSNNTFSPTAERTLHTWYVWIGLKYSSISLMASHCAERERERERKKEREGKHSWVSHMYTFFLDSYAASPSVAVYISHMSACAYVCP